MFAFLKFIYLGFLEHEYLLNLPCTWRHARVHLSSKVKSNANDETKTLKGIIVRMAVLLETMNLLVKISNPLGHLIPFYFYRLHY